MATFCKMTVKALLVATLLPLTAMADDPAPANHDGSDTPVIVIRGSQVQVQGGPQKVVKAGRRVAPSDQSAQAVIVMRPAPGSFMRETTRLTAEADAREERAAREEAREANLRLSEALQAVQDAANATQTQPHKYYWVIAPHQIAVPAAGGRAVDPRIGKFFPKVAGMRRGAGVSERQVRFSSYTPV